MNVLLRTQICRYVFAPFLLVVSLLGTPVAWGTDSDVVVEGLAIAETLKKLRDEVCLNALASGRLPPPPFCDDVSFKYVFVTSTPSGGNFGGIAVADAICNTLASAAGLPGFYKAWLSTSTEDAKDRIGDHKWVRTDGVGVADGLADLLDGIGVSIDVTEAGVSGAVYPFTGTGADGTKVSAGGDYCADWTAVGPPTEVLIGGSDGGPETWTQFGTAGCGQPAQHYCFGIDDPPLLAVAYMNDDGIDGYSKTGDALIAGLYDFNEDGVVSAGDVVRTNQYPLDFDATTRGVFQTTLHTVYPSGTPQEGVVQVCAQGCVSTFRWIALTSPFWESYYETSSSNPPPSPHETEFSDQDEAYFQQPMDVIRVDQGTTSAPSTPENLTRPAGTDDAFIDVDINL